MSDKTNNLIRFWQELKRRKVIKVIAMYAGVAYIIIELTNNIAEPLQLPAWTATLIILLLAIGFPIVAILSWIFDVTPEGIKKTEPDKAAVSGKTIPKSPKRKLKVSDVLIAVLFVVTGILIYPKIFKKDKFEGIRNEDGRISVAVMPFTNMTGDTIWDIWQNGIQNELITNLSNSRELAVCTYQTMNDILQSSKHANYASITPVVARDISRKLEANTFIQGSIKKSGDVIRINAQLINSETEEIYKTFRISGNSEDDIFRITDSLSRLVINYLEIKVLGQNVDADFKKISSTKSPESLKYYIQGINLFNSNNYAAAAELFMKALEADSNYFAANFFLMSSYYNLDMPEKAIHYFHKLYAHYEDVSYDNQLLLKHSKSYLDKDPYESIKYSKLYLDNNPQSRLWWLQLGYDYSRINQYGNAVKAYKRALEIDKLWGGGFKWVAFYTNPGRAYHEYGNHVRENEIYDLGLSVLPDDPYIIASQAVCALSQGETKKAGEFLAKYKSIREAKGWNEDQIKRSIGRIYQDAEQYDKAIEIYRDLIEKNAESPLVKWQLASILIDNEINVDEGMELINQALKIEPDNYFYLATKGWGLYKQGQLEESLAVLKESWDLNPYYIHDHYLHMQEVKQALSDQNK